MIGPLELPALDGEGPAYGQIYAHLRGGILRGDLAPGTRLPGSRKLASALGVARITVVQAYERLGAEGFIEARRGAGSRVTPDLGKLPGRTERAAAPRLAPYARRVLAAPTGGRCGGKSPSVPYDFQYGRPGLTPELKADWCRALRRACTGLTPDYPEVAGDPDLRECLAAYLRDHRGIPAEPERILITTGAQQALDLIGRVVLEPGDRVALEEPHYQGARQAFEALGARTVAVPVGRDGLQTARLPERPAPRLAYVTPSHQFPLGGVLPAAARLALLEWAGRRRATIIEDDYDSEFRHEGGPLQSLCGLDRGGRVLYMGTFSKVLFPALRLGYLVAPQAWIEPLARVRWLADRGGPPLEQRALAGLFRSGAFRRHVERTARRLAARRQVLVDALEEHFGDDIQILGARSGMHLVIRFPHLGVAGVDRLAGAAEQLGVGVYTTAAYYADARHRRPDLLLGYGDLDRERIRAGVAGLRRALRELPGRADRRRP